ncbi:LmeA family phospholipid-binding protein [Streptomyces sparsus]
MRALRITLIIVLVLGGLFVGADRLAVTLVEDRLVDEVKRAQNAKEATVSIHGFPFLTQIASKELESVDISLTGVTRETAEGSLRVSEFDVEARDIQLADDYSGGVADRATGTALLSYGDLTAAADENVRVEYGGPSTDGEAKVKVTGSVDLPVLDQPVERSTTSTVSVENGDTIRLHADEIPGSDIPGLENLIRERIDYTRKIDGLPSGVRLEKIETSREGVEVHFSGSDVNVTG